MAASLAKPEAMREVAIFRHNLFKVSEPFITQQAQQLRDFKPLYVGRMRYGDAPNGTDSLALQDRSAHWSLPGIGLQMLTRNPQPYQRLLRDHHPALIHAHFGIEGVYALPLAQRLHIPLVTTFHGYDATLATRHLLRNPAWANYPLFRNQLARRGALFLCASAFIREQVLKMGFPEARTVTHHIGIDVQAITPRHPDEEKPVILHVGRLVEVKGTRYLIQAFAKVAREAPSTRLVIIGDGPLRKRLQAQASALGIVTRVDFLGSLPHPEVMAWMRKATMLILPSIRTRSGRTEGLGMVLLEAAASGVPAIGSRQGGIPEVVIDGETGLLTAAKESQELSARMLNLLDNTAMRRRMGTNARTLMKQQFDIHKQTRTLETHYDRVLSEAGNPAS